MTEQTQKTSFSIRTIRPEDDETLREIAHLCGHNDAELSIYWVIAKFFNEHSFIAYKDDKPIGFIITAQNGFEVLVWQLCIVATEDDENTFTALLDAMFQSYRAQFFIWPAYIASDIFDMNGFKNYCAKRKYIIVHDGPNDTPHAVDNSKHNNHDINIYRIAQK